MKQTNNGSKQIIKTPVGEINITPVQPNETIIEAKPEEFSFTIEKPNGVKITFEKIPNRAGLTANQFLTILDDILFAPKRNQNDEQN